MEGKVQSLPKDTTASSMMISGYQKKLFNGFRNVNDIGKLEKQEGQIGPFKPFRERKINDIEFED